MAEGGDPAAEVVEIIESSKLSANDQCLLTRSVQLTLERASMAKYVLDRIFYDKDRGIRSLEETLLVIKSDLIELGQKMNGAAAVSPNLDTAVREREKHRCCLTGETKHLQATYVVAPSILDDEDLGPEGRLRGLLEASISPRLVKQLYTFLGSRSIEDELKNMWLLSPSVRHDFQHGSVKILRAPAFGPADFYVEEQKPVDKWNVWITVPELTRVKNARKDGHGNIIFEPSTPDNARLPLPKTSLLRIHAAVSLPLHFLVVENQIRRGWPLVKKDWGILGSIGIYLLRVVIQFIPTSLRVALYRHTVKGRFFPRHRLPFGLYVKDARRPSMHNEANALRLVEKHAPTVPAPRLIDFVVPEGKNMGFILMTKVRGDRLDHGIYWMTHEERRQLGRDLGKCISQWRCIPNHSPYQITSTLGGPAYDHRFEDGECGPYKSNAEFADYQTEYLEDKRQEPPLSALYKKHHQIFFTHSDLHQTNIFVEGGRLSGVIDWEHAGFKPEYWEYTRGLLSYFGRGEHKTILDQAFQEDYEDELEAQKFLWKVAPVF